jgi:hypothetical protein
MTPGTSITVAIRHPRKRVPTICVNNIEPKDIALPARMNCARHTLRYAVKSINGTGLRVQRDSGLGSAAADRDRISRFD